MICKTCDREVPDTIVTLECAECVYKRLHRGFDEHQLDYLRLVHEGRYPLIIHTVPRGVHRGFGVRMAFCGKVSCRPSTKYAPDEEELGQGVPEVRGGSAGGRWQALAPAADVVVKQALLND
jgi:hypothetical protein